MSEFRSPEEYAEEIQPALEDMPISIEAIAAIKNKEERLDTAPRSKRRLVSEVEKDPMGVGEDFIEALRRDSDKANSLDHIFSVETSKGIVNTAITNAPSQSFAAISYHIMLATREYIDTQVATDQEIVWEVVHDLFIETVHTQYMGEHIECTAQDDAIELARLFEATSIELRFLLAEKLLSIHNNTRGIDEE